MTWMDDLQNALEARAEVRLAVLFGSSARQGAGRDADIALIIAPDTPALRRSLEADLGRAAGRAVDAIYLDEAHLSCASRSPAKVLIERSAHLWADVRACAMIDWWDWAPQARMLFAAAARRLREKVPSGQA